MKPTLAESGPRAIAAMEKACAAGQPFRLVLLDAFMPAIDGFSVAAEIRRRPELASAALMMLSSGGTTEDLIDAVK